MEQPADNAQRIDRFFAACRAAPARALLLDYDGTLAPFRVERDQAFPYPGVREALEELIGLGRTRVAAVSGRVAGEVEALLGLARPLEIWGAHGWERRRADGGHEAFDIGPQAMAGLTEAARWSAERRLTERLECKQGSLALHWRDLAPAEREALEREAAPAWAAIGRRSGLEPHPFDGGLELRAPGRCKGTAVKALLEELPEGAAAAFLGDDRTDEDGFKALARIAGERGLGVLVRPKWRPTAARAWLRPPGELLEFLARWRAMDRGEK